MIPVAISHAPSIPLGFARSITLLPLFPLISLLATVTLIAWFTLIPLISALIGLPVP